MYGHQKFLLFSLKKKAAFKASLIIYIFVHYCLIIYIYICYTMSVSNWLTSLHLWNRGWIAHLHVKELAWLVATAEIHLGWGKTETWGRVPQKEWAPRTHASSLPGWLLMLKATFQHLISTKQWNLGDRGCQACSMIPCTGWSVAEGLLAVQL